MLRAMMSMLNKAKAMKAYARPTSAHGSSRPSLQIGKTPVPIVIVYKNR